MTNTDLILTKINELQHDLSISERASAIAKRVPGWSGRYHHLFFQSVFAALPEIKSVLILGVYLGRDITTMLDCAPNRPLQITGVDKFNAEPCEDWPAEKRGMTWQEAFNCLPPDKEVALENIKPAMGLLHAVNLIKEDDALWLPKQDCIFDFVYVDTSHDEATVTRQLRQVRKLCHPGTIIAGDDYENIEKAWGVKDAVTKGFKQHHAMAGTIWFAGAEDFK